MLEALYSTVNLPLPAIVGPEIPGRQWSSVVVIHCEPYIKPAEFQWSRAQSRAFRAAKEYGRTDAHYPS
jgi:hypothetical protein